MTVPVGQGMRAVTRSDARRTARIAALAAAVALSACSGGGNEGNPLSGLNCVDDSQHCIGERQGALKSMLADKDKRWVREQPTPTAYASGVRLFAFKSRKAHLTCEELALGKREAESAGTVLRGPGGAGLSPSQISRGAMLAAEVSKELDGELRKRCRV